jgi:hypothetical protein
MLGLLQAQFANFAIDSTCSKRLPKHKPRVSDRSSAILERRACECCYRDGGPALDEWVDGAKEEIFGVSGGLDGAVVWSWRGKSFGLGVMAGTRKIGVVEFQYGW